MSDSIETAKAQISEAIRKWVVKLDEYPGWREWQRAKIGYTLRFDDELVPPKGLAGEFKFSTALDAEHAIIMRYLALQDTVSALRDVEWYFRRYPFAGTPVTRYNHLTHCCELFFGRFYQFRERLKNLFDALSRVEPSHGLDAGKFIKLFDKDFADEIRARHGVHHRERFDDVTISRVLLMECLARPMREQGWEKEHVSHYRKAANEWAARTRRRADRMDVFVEAIAAALLKVCPFLNETSHS